MREQLKKAIALAKKTKSSVIMFDAENPQDTFVLLDLDQYEKMIEKKIEKVNLVKEKNDLTEDNLADKINREISLWKNQENSDSLEEEEVNKKRWQIPPHVKNKAKEIQ
jgi:uncharacterized protein YnzC (UPF0291/DUF896 family)